MCGITFVHSNDLHKIKTNELQGKVSKRGPDDERYISIESTAFLGFNRLRIQDQSSDAMQPFCQDNVWMMCNGEIFNWKELVKKYDLKLKTDCDCEVILHLFNLFTSQLPYAGAVEKLCNELDAEFAFVLYVKAGNFEEDIVIAARDPFGVRPLFFGDLLETHGVGFGSEMKSIQEVCSRVEQFPPGHYIVSNKIYSYRPPFPKIDAVCDMQEDSALHSINSALKTAVKKRLMSDREICCLLSGGLDSSLIAGLVSQHFPPGTLKTFSIGLKGSPDLHYAKLVAKHIQSDHTSIEMSEEEFLDAIDKVIFTIESYDTTTVRASVGNYLVSKYIRENSECKVVFNGDYADEVCGGYKYFTRCDDETEFHDECIRLTNHIHYFDSLRSDRCISSNGLEARVPFADKNFVMTYLALPAKLRMSNVRIEKYLLRKAFEGENIIPNEILWRKKEAFSDGVSSIENSWHKILKSFVDKHLTEDEYIKMKEDPINPAISKETAFYKSAFKKHFKFDSAIPYFWLPRFCGDMNGEPSAREID